MSTRILCDIACRLGEGPTYDPGSDTLFWFDILDRKLLERPWPDGPTRVHDLPVMASALAVVDADRQLLVTETGLQLRDRHDGALAMHLPVEADRPQTRSNDSRVHPSGALWFSTMGKGAEPGAGSIYWYCAGELRLLYPALGIPNSICFSPGGAIAYFTDSAAGILWRVGCDPDSGLPRGEPVPFVDHRAGPGELDGSVVDAEGTLWNARWGAGSLDAYDGQGRRIRSVPIPAGQSSCPAFAGPAADRLVVTSAWQGLDAAARRADPMAGKTFLVDLAVSGRHEPRVLL